LGHQAVFKVWVNWIELVQPHRGGAAPRHPVQSGQRCGVVFARRVEVDGGVQSGVAPPTPHPHGYRPRPRRPNPKVGGSPPGHRLRRRHV
jgi:hypothetical protein